MAETTTVRVEVDALDELRLAVVKKHGQLHGNLGGEVSEALRKHAKDLEEDEE